MESCPPQTIILDPVQTALWPMRPLGAPVAGKAPSQLLVTGSYRLPVLKNVVPSYPPQRITSLPVQTALGLERAESAPDSVVVPVQVSVSGSYRPPVLRL